MKSEINLGTLHKKYFNQLIATVLERPYIVNLLREIDKGIEKQFYPSERLKFALSFTMSADELLVIRNYFCDTNLALKYFPKRFYRKRAYLLVERAPFIGAGP